MMHEASNYVFVPHKNVNNADQQEEVLRINNDEFTAYTAVGLV